MRKKIRIDQGVVEGYGGPGYDWARVTCDNLLLESFKSPSEGDIAVSICKAKQKWSKDWTVEAWEKATKGKKQASPLCSVCGGDTLDGISSCVEMTFCKKCVPRIDEFRKKYAEKVEKSRRESDLKQQSIRDHRSQETRTLLAGAFHWKDGWYFKRMKDGSVRVMHSAEMPMTGEEYLHPDLTIPPNEWASIVCSVSAGGETGERWEASQDFHGRELITFRRVS